jgi:hypothetical protein
MPDTLVERLREMNNRYIGLTTLDKELKALLTEAADALSAATERERGLLDLLDLTTTELGWLLDGGLPNMATMKRYELAQAWLAEHKGTPRG